MKEQQESVEIAIKEIGDKISKSRQASTLQLAIIFMTTCCAMIGPMYMSDLPQLYEDSIIRIFDKTALDIGSLYTIFSLPNLVMTPLGTFLLTYTGLGLGSVLFQSLVVLGAIMINYGFLNVQYGYVFWGRAVYGLGCEVAIIICATVADKWFSGKLLTFAQGSNRALAFLGQFLSMFVGTSFFVKQRKIQLSMLSYVVVSYLGFLMAVAYCVLDHVLTRKFDREETELNAKKDTLIAQLKDLKGQAESQRIAAQLKQSLKKSASSGSGKFDGKVSFKGETGRALIDQYQHENPDPEIPDSEFSIGSIRSFSALFWVTSGTFALGTMLQFQFLTFATDCLVNRYGYGFEEAKNTIAIMPIASLLISPFAAAFIGKVGRKPLILVIDVMLGIGIFVFMRSLEVKPGVNVAISIGMIGVFYAIFVALIWPAMTLTVPQTTTAAALGLATTLQNIFITGLSYFFGFVNLPRTKSAYDTSFLSLVVVGVISLVLSVMVLIMDQATGGLLSLPDADERVGTLRRKIQIKYNKECREKEAKKKSKKENPAPRRKDSESTQFQPQTQTEDNTEALN